MKMKFLLVAFYFSLIVGATPPDTLNFSVTNDTAVSRNQWPVTGGVSLNRGVIKSLENLQLVGGDGQPVDFQGRTMSRWDDGSVKWVLLDFQGTFAPQEKKAYTLNYGPSVTYAKPPGITLSRGNGTITINTGAQTFQLQDNKIPVFREQIIGIQH